MPELFMYVVSTAIERAKKEPKTPTKTPNQKVSCNEWQFSLFLFVVDFLLVIILEKNQSLTTTPSTLELNIQHCLLVT